MNQKILAIVEGQSEVESVPILLRRIRNQMQAFSIQIARPFRIKRNKVVQEGQLERAIVQGVSDRDNVGAVLVLLDADDDCPAILGPQLMERGKQVTQLPIAVVLAKMEMEGWFLGGKESLRGVCGIRSDAIAPLNPENIRGAKERISNNMVNKRRYLEVDDQPVLAAKFDFDLTKSRCPSFEKFLREVQNLINKIKGN